MDTHKNAIEKLGFNQVYTRFQFHYTYYIPQTLAKFNNPASNFQEEVGRLNNRIEQMMVEHNNVVLERNGLQQQCTQAVRKWDITLREREKLEDDLTKVLFLYSLFFVFLVGFHERIFLMIWIRSASF